MPGGPSAAVRFSVREGPQILVDHILIVGNARISERTIRNEVALEPGKPLSLTAVNESQRTPLGARPVPPRRPSPSCSTARRTSGTS